jgi:hypothetical protein
MVPDSTTTGMRLSLAEVLVMGMVGVFFGRLSVAYLFTHITGTALSVGVVG